MIIRLKHQMNFRSNEVIYWLFWNKTPVAWRVGGYVLYEDDKELHLEIDYASFQAPLIRLGLATEDAWHHMVVPIASTSTTSNHHHHQRYCLVIIRIILVLHVYHLQWQLAAEEDRGISIQTRSVENELKIKSTI